MVDIAKECRERAQQLRGTDRAFDIATIALLKEATDEIERLQDAKRRAMAIADERAKENVALRMALEKISGRREYLSSDHEAAARYKPEDGLWTTDEYLADAALDLSAVRSEG